MADYPIRAPAHLSQAASEALAQRRRGRNIAMLVGLLALVALFYFISIAKLSHPDHAHSVAASGADPN